jgi:hypothetical protein
MISAAEACDLKRYSAVVVGIFCCVSPANYILMILDPIYIFLSRDT